MAAAVRRAESLVDRGGRLLAIAGLPGAGKSTLTDALLTHFGDDAAIAPMDGFHLGTRQLNRRGAAEVKGAPHTFDAHGFVNAVRRLRAEADIDVFWPRFDRTIEDSIAADLCVPSSARLVVVEGNYVLLNIAPWDQLVGVFDETWMVEVEPATRIERLIARHIEFGRTAEAAREWVQRSDERNAELITTSSSEPDVVIRLY